jgi:hypothetical protein
MNIKSNLNIASSTFFNTALWPSQFFHGHFSLLYPMDDEDRITMYVVIRTMSLGGYGV